MAEIFYVGVDLGGTNIKAGVLDADARVLCSLSVPTEVGKGRDAVVANIIGAAEQAIGKSGVNRVKVAGIGIGSPGPL
ncbi:MAG TPA: hydantoinase/oxoprolinase N-terminal domain-containing protein, partial [Phycisphaerae bacterium]|nr:hydantoinase/oxoprolinase N-terminal domain-containing protein [Phycisphaerae bacterium]